MNKNNNLKTAILIVSTIVLAMVAIGTAFWLYQLQSQPVAPNVPESKPKATAPSQANCTGSVSFTLAAAIDTDSPATPTPTPTRAIGGPVPTATPTPTPRPTVTTTPTATPTPASVSTGSGSQTTPTPTSSAAKTETLPNVGVSWPVMAGISAGALVLFIGILLAL